MKTFAYICFTALILSSCSTNKFLNRKYTSGVFVEAHKNLTNNSIKPEGKTHTTAAPSVELKKSNLLSETQTERESIITEINLLSKKENISYDLKISTSEIHSLKNNSPKKAIKENRSFKRYSLKVNHANYSDAQPGEKEITKDLLIRTLLCLALISTPFAGWIIANQTKKQIKEYQLQSPEINYTPYKIIVNITLVLSIINTVITILILLLAITLLLLLCFSSSGFFVLALL